MLIRALTSHYRRHPLQLLALALMILLSSALWSGIHHLTSQARHSLGDSEGALAERTQVVRDDGRPVTVTDFVRLRRAGLCVMPWLEVLPADGGAWVVGVDPLAAHCAARQPAADGLSGQALDGRPFLDIADAAGLSARASRLSLLWHDNGVPLPAGYRRDILALAPDTGQLGDSFLLNLDALSVLVLLITALLLRSVYRLSLAQRRDSLALLVRLGVPERRLHAGLLAELLVLSLVCVVPGLWLGQGLASGLGQGFGQALNGLFDARVYATDGAGPLRPLLIMVAVVLVACAWGAGSLGRPVNRGTGKVVVWAGGLALILGGALVVLAPALWLLFVAVALVFLGYGLLTPRVLAAVAARAATRVPEPLARWRWREFGVLCRRLALPLVALQFALALVLAVQALVTTFETTFEQWLAQRLSADYYLELPDGASGAEALTWLRAQDLTGQGGAYHRVIRGRGRVVCPACAGPQPIDVFALAPIGPLVHSWTLLAGDDRAWPRVAAGEAVLVNEQLARRLGLSVGDVVQLRFTDGPETGVQAPVAGIYADYGRPAGEVLMAARVLPPAFAATFESLSLSPGRADLAALVAGLESVWASGPVTVRDADTIRQLASQVFDQTFRLTRAMTALTLLLSALALLLMGWVFLMTRVWYLRLLAVWGLTRVAMAGQLLRLAVGVALATWLLALPLGIGLTWVLVARINPMAFGWALPMAAYPGFWLVLAGVALAVGAAIAGLMALALRRLALRPTPASLSAGGER